MKLSASMVNFLGYLYHDCAQRWLDRRTAVGLVSTFGINAALRNGLIEEHLLHLPAPDPSRRVPGLSYDKEHFDGYRLTERGALIGAIGAIMRSDETVHLRRAAYVDKAQRVFDQHLAISAA